jgi:DNA-binding IclR family transcriptional regulator
VRVPDAGLVARIRSEFLEMRGFSPTLQQAGRLFHLAHDECRQVLAALVHEGFLHEERDGRYRLSRHR